MTGANTDLSRLRWRCRRGTLELDLLFDRFLANIYPSLAVEERRIFDEFLDAADPLIMTWITGKATPMKPEFVKIIQLLRRGGNAMGTGGKLDAK